MDKREIVGLPLPVPSVIQGATPLFGQTLVEEPHRLLDDVFSTGTMRAFLFLNLLMQFLLKSQKEPFALGVSLTGLLPDLKKQ